MVFTAAHRYFILALYFLFICFLFFLPGEAFPQGGNWMEVIQFDKWVHFGIFSLLTAGTCWALRAAEMKTLYFVLGSAVAYGIAVEFIQDQFIVNRSFDLGDWAADIVGSISGTWFWWVRSIKNRPL
jgi:VanZ family protein